MLNHAKVVFTTVSSACAFGENMKTIKNVSESHFDVCIIDEASQCVETASYIPMLQADKTVLAGDHHQLPPIVPNSVVKDVHNLKVKIERGVNPFEQFELETDAESTVGTDTGTLIDAAENPETVTLDLEQSAVKKFLTTTLMERMDAYYPKHICHLDTQYRMNKKILEWSNKIFYNNKIKTHESVTSQTLSDKKLQIKMPNLFCEKGEYKNSYPPLIFINTPHSTEMDGNKVDSYYTELDVILTNDSKANMGEAAFCLTYCRYLVDECYMKETDIGVISPYAEQVNYIKHGLKENNLNEIVVSSVDGFQGQEREVIILSLARCNTYNKIGFLKDLRRMNVAVTRAKRHILIIGNQQTLEEGDKDIESFIKFFRDSTGCRSMFYKDFLERISSVVTYSESIELYIPFVNGKLKALGINKQYEYDTSRNCLRQIKCQLKKREDLEDTWGDIEKEEFQDLEFNFGDEPIFSKPHSHGLSDRILKSKQQRQNQFEFNVEQKYSYKFERFDRNVDTNQKCKIWMENDGTEINETMKNEEVDHEKGIDDWAMDSNDTKMFDHESGDILENRKKSTNTENKFCLLKNESSSETESEESGRTYVSSIIEL